jgi:DNA-binding transcriptional MerR regulator
MIQQTFTIKDLSQLTRIKPHTLRIWEQRYGIMNPQRTDSNIRVYNQDDLKYLLNVSILYDSGFKISNIAKLRLDEINEKVRELSSEKNQIPSQIQNLVIAMLDLDEDRFEKQLSNSILRIGIEQTIVSIIYPFLQHIGILWQTNTINPAQEHFITNLIRQKLIVAIDGISSRPKRNTVQKKVILYLPEGELHEISLLFACYMVKSMGHKSIYLGQSLPVHDLKAVQDTVKADIILSIITSNPCLEDVQPYILKLHETFPGQAIWLTGYQVLSQELEVPERITLIQNTEIMKEMLDNL